MMIGTLYRCTQQFSIPFITLDGEKDTVTILPGEAVWRLHLLLRYLHLLHKY